MTSEVSASGHGGMNAYNGSSLEIVTVVLIAVSFVVVLVRGVARYRISRVAEPSDVLLPLTLVVAIAQSVCVRVSLSSGLGRHVASLSSDQLTEFQQLTYASNLLFQLVLSLSEVIVVLLIKSVEPQRPVRIACNVLLGCIGVYTTLSLSILAFQCSLPEPWLVAADRCVDRQSFLTSFVIVSIIIDAATLLLPIIMVCRLKTPRDKKIFVCILFGTRLALPLVTAPQIYRLKKVLVSQDQTWDLVSFQLWEQIVMNISVITACLPSLGRMLWELMTRGSAGLRSTWAASRDFGHELGLDKGQGQGQGQAQAQAQARHLGLEKPYIQQPSPAFSPAGEKGSWGDQVIVQVRSIGSFESFESGRTLVSQEPTAVDVQKQEEKDELPPTMMPQQTATGTGTATASMHYVPRRPYHHYRRPLSNLLSPVLEQSPALGAALPPTLTGQHYPHHQGRGPYEAPPPAYLTPGPRDSPTRPWDTTSSLYDEDLSEIDIDSYYMQNNQISQSYHPSRTELVLDSMIEDLQRENAGVKPSQGPGGAWI
ncbi:hypothetical protein A1O1_06217 [Capronia coronata CBS 617.96]|uniref:Rhodopsin domain-containing protein n=1 Tax=Capronia coronata CBS 617.96 TaxID=1182541 RepID=W9Y071_9EURO|nr:uncharacterized protein A1O1_06217 [Capronia coronata CBS 617.96]EXJ85848.1 hypothetical protein A1O1_06217 [Capronia coronata CBS 617.96]